jgi:hypothetical protein
MSIFAEFQDDEQNQIRARFHELIGPVVDNQGVEKDFIDAFNQDIKLINHSILHPASELESYRKAYGLQEEYNAALEKAKARWTQSQKGFELGAVVVKDLVSRKQDFESGMDAMQVYKARMQQIDEFGYEESKEGSVSLWRQLQLKAIELDKKDLDDIKESILRIAFKLDEKDKGNRFNILSGFLPNKISPKNYQDKLMTDAKIQDKQDQLQRVSILQEIFEHLANRSQKLKQVKIDWFAQDYMTKCNSRDLMKVSAEMQNMEALLQFTRDAYKGKALKDIDNIIILKLKENEDILNECREKLTNAASWRLLSANSANNLRCDDVLFALTKELRFKVFLGDDATDLGSLAKVLTISIDGLSYHGDFESFNFFVKHLRQNAPSLLQKNWLSSRWILNQDKRNLIAVTLKDGYLVPQKIAHLVPDKMGILPGSWIRYWFFRTHEKLGRIWSWIRKKLIGEYNETITCINETYRQVDNFEQNIRSNRATGKSLNLTNISQSTAFKSALELPKLIENEITRSQGIKPSWVFGVLLKWVPILNRASLYEFYNILESEFDRSKRYITAK